MPALPAPLSLTEPAVAEWLYESYWGSAHHAPFDYKLNGKSDWNRQARAVLALVEDRVRAALECADERDAADNLVYPTHDAIAAKVMS